MGHPDLQLGVRELCGPTHAKGVWATRLEVGSVISDAQVHMGFVKPGIPPFPFPPSRAIVTFARRPKNNLVLIGTPLPAHGRAYIWPVQSDRASCRYAEVFPFRHRAQSSEPTSSQATVQLLLHHPRRPPREEKEQQVSHHRGGHTASHFTRNRGLYADKLRTHHRCHSLPTRRRMSSTPHIDRTYGPATPGQRGHTGPIHGVALKIQSTVLHAAAACLA